MPVTFHPAPNLKAEPFDKLIPNSNTPAGILHKSCPNQFKKSSEILQSSFSEHSKANILPQNNGFVHSITQAYSTHQALVIRPDDVWLAILVQFNFYVNANAELLRSQFVGHEGKKDLIVYADGNRYTVDFGRMASAMTALMQRNIVDPTLREWILPDFSTTTDNDTIVSAIVMMATLKEYFSYTFFLRCGIPRVTLEGEKSDWESILNRIERLKGFGLQTIAWYHLLHPVLSQFVRAFDEPQSTQNSEFWQRVAHYSGGGSGPTWLSGWITVFCVFDTKGKWIGDEFKSPSQTDPASLTTSEFMSFYFGDPSHKHCLKFGDSCYHRIDTQLIPAGFAEVDVILVDNSITFETLMVAGSVATELRDNYCTLRPVSGWWMFIKTPETVSEEKAELIAKNKTGGTSSSQNEPDKASLSSLGQTQHFLPPRRHHPSSTSRRAKENASVTSTPQTPTPQISKPEPEVPEKSSRHSSQRNSDVRTSRRMSKKRPEAKHDSGTYTNRKNEAGATTRSEGSGFRSNESKKPNVLIKPDGVRSPKTRPRPQLLPQSYQTKQLPPLPKEKNIVLRFFRAVGAKLR